MNQFPSSQNAMRTRLVVEERELVQYVMCPKSDTLCGEAKHAYRIDCSNEPNMQITCLLKLLGMDSILGRITFLTPLEL